MDATSRGEGDGQRASRSQDRPVFSSPANMVTKLVQAGADGLVMFNRFYEPDIDLASLAPQTDLQAQHTLRNPTAIDVDRPTVATSESLDCGYHRRVDP